MTDIPLPDSVIAAGVMASIQSNQCSHQTASTHIFLAMARALVEHDRDKISIQWLNGEPDQDTIDYAESVIASLDPTGKRIQ